MKTQQYLIFYCSPFSYLNVRYMSPLLVMGRNSIGHYWLCLCMSAYVHVFNGCADAFIKSWLFIPKPLSIRMITPPLLNSYSQRTWMYTVQALCPVNCGTQHFFFRIFLLNCTRSFAYLLIFFVDSAFVNNVIIYHHSWSRIYH